MSASATRFHCPREGCFLDVPLALRGLASFGRGWLCSGRHWLCLLSPLLECSMTEQNIRRFPPPWTVEQIPGGYKVLDANGQSLAYVYERETKADADIAHVLTMGEA